MLIRGFLGALLNDIPKDVDDVSTWDFFGSTLVCLAESKQEVLDKLKADPYATSGTWDMEKVCCGRYGHGSLATFFSLTVL